MGRKPNPTAIKILKGAKKNRINLNEPKYKTHCGKPPKFLDVVAKEEWTRLWPEVKSVMTEVDAMSFAAYCSAFSHWKQADKFLKEEKKLIFKTPNGSIQQSPFVAMARNWMLVMIRIAAELGFTPSSRSKVLTKKTKDDDEEFLFSK